MKLTSLNGALKGPWSEISLEEDKFHVVLKITWKPGVVSPVPSTSRPRNF